MEVGDVLPISDRLVKMLRESKRLAITCIRVRRALVWPLDLDALDLKAELPRVDELTEDVGTLERGAREDEDVVARRADVLNRLWARSSKGERAYGE